MIDKKLLKNLEQCLSDIVSVDEHFGIDEMRGLFYAQMITPDKGNPLDWVAALFYGERPKLSEEQVNGLNRTAEAVYEAYKSLFAGNKLKFPFNFDQLDPELAESVYAWSQGFFIGLSINELFWFGKKGEKYNDKEIEAVRNSAKLFTGLVTKDFSDFDKVKIAELKAFIIDQGQEPTDDIIAATLFPNIPTAVRTLQVYGTKVMRTPAPAPKMAGQPNRKIGRNDPCHCGSGKKYKKCCG